MPAIGDVPLLGEVAGNGAQWLQDQLLALGIDLQCMMETCTAAMDSCVHAASSVMSTLRSEEMQDMLARSPAECVTCVSDCGSTYGTEEPEECGTCMRDGICQYCDPSIKVAACGELEAEDFGFDRRLYPIHRFLMAGNMTSYTFEDLIKNPELAEQYIEEWFAAIGPELAQVMSLSVRPADLSSNSTHNSSLTMYGDGEGDSYNPCAQCIGHCATGYPNTGDECTDCYSEAPQCAGCDHLADRYCEGHAMLALVGDMATAVESVNMSDGSAGSVFSDTFLCANCLLTCLRNTVKDVECYDCFDVESSCASCSSVFPEWLAHPCAIRKLIVSIQETMRWSCACYQNVQRCLGGSADCSAISFADVVDDCPDECGIMCNMKHDYFSEDYLNNMLAEYLDEDQIATALGGEQDPQAVASYAPDIPPGGVRYCVLSEDYVLGACSAVCEGKEGVRKLGRIIDAYPFGPGARCPAVEYVKCNGTSICDLSGQPLALSSLDRCKNRLFDEDLETDLDCE